jgi:anaerobic magnesium-protoporphyrin IX monomethyl ester cyclase
VESSDLSKEQKRKLLQHRRLGGLVLGKQTRYPNEAKVHVMKITLIRPPAYSSTGLMGAQLVPYLGIAYIGAALRAAGHSVDIVDMCAEDITHTEIIDGKFVQYGMPFTALNKRLSHADIFGFTCMFSQDWPFHRWLIRYVHDLFPESAFIAGGEHITALPEYSLKDCPELDICVLGEGEDISVQLAKTLEAKENLNKVKGIVFRSSVTEVFGVTARAPRIRDIDRLSWPAWDLIPLEAYLSRGLTYHIKRGRTLPLLASRGCPYQCTFCSNTKMWNAPWVAREAKDVVDEMEFYKKQYGAENFVFSDLTAVIKKENIIDLCRQIIDRKISVTWQLPTLRTEAVDRPVLELMYQAGCRDLDFALESGSTAVLESVNKRNDPTRIFRLIEDGLAAGMNLSTNIVIGLPQEGFKDFLQTYWLMMRLAVKGLQELNVFPFIPYPGSKLFDDFLKSGKIKLADTYFLNLFGYADLSKAISWSDRFGPKTLSWLRFILLSHFYALMLLTHPVRLWRLIVNSIQGKTTTKLEGVLRRIWLNLLASILRWEKDND